jgi:AcrR family transcriptional regulator
MSEARSESRPGRWNGTERRNQLAAITLQVIAEHGVRGATVRRIAEAAGVSSPALYNHFSGRTELLEAACDILLERVLNWVDSSTNPNMLERLREIAGELHDSKITGDEGWLIVPLFELSAAARAEGLTERMSKNQLTVLQRFVDIVEEGKRQGTIRPDADSEAIGWNLMGLRWTKDFALLEGLGQFITRGTAGRILDGIIGSIAVRPEPAAAAAPGGQ